MTEAELASLFHDHVDSVVTILFGYFSVTSAFLVASHLTGPSWSKALSRVVIALYSLTALSLIGYCERHANMVVRIREELRAAGADWHSAVAEPSYLLPGLTYGMVIAMFAIFVASVWYHAHRQSTAADMR